MYKLKVINIFYKILQVLLHRLGYVERPKGLGIITVTANQNTSQSRNTKPKQVFKICVLGKDGVGKRSFVFALSKLSNESTPYGPGDNSTSPLERVTPKNKAELLEFVTGGCAMAWSGASGGGAAMDNTGNDAASSENNCHLLFTSVPLSCNKAWIQQQGQTCDLAVVVIDITDRKSFETAVELEKALPHNLPRVYVANKMDLLHNNSEFSEINSRSLAESYIKENDLSPLVCISTHISDDMDKALESVIQVLKTPDRGIPLHIRKKRNVWPLKYMLGTASAIIIGGFVIYISASEDSDGDKKRNWIEEILFSAKSFVRQSVHRMRRLIR